MARGRRNPLFGSVLGRCLGALFALGLGLLAAFLFTAFAIVAAALALVGLVRLWWVGRAARRRAGDAVIPADYTVSPSANPDEARTPDAILPPGRRGRTD